MNDTPFEARRGPPLAYWLGYAGLIPFVVGALGLWLLPAGLHGLTDMALRTYGALILSFLGAVHWGLAMRSAGHPANLQLELGVLPSLVAWLALMLPAPWSYPALMLTFVVVLGFDLQATRQGLTPAWYPSLRVPLTAVAVLLLGAAWVEVLLR